jgi:hypothetical protein
MTKKQIASILFGGLIALLVAVGFVGGALVHMTGTAPHSAERLTDGETRMLAQVAAHRSADGHYNVLMPETITVPLWAHDPGMAFDARDFMVTAFRKQGVDAGVLLDRLYQVNAKSVRLSLSSAPLDGYLVDDGTYDKYFQFGGGGWSKLHEEHGQVASIVRYSRPVYDEATGLFLVYRRTDTASGGSGEFLLYRNGSGTLKQVGAEQLWVR